MVLFSALALLVAVPIAACGQTPPASLPAITPTSLPPPTTENQQPTEPSKAKSEKQEPATEYDSAVRITYINYRGRDYAQHIGAGFYTVEADEYVEIKNLSDAEQDISGWMLKNLTRGQPLFIFPSYLPCWCEWYDTWQDCISHCRLPRPCVIKPRESIRVYTDEVHPESGGFCFHYFPGDIWCNQEANTAVLYNSKGKEVSRKSYAINPPK